MFLATMFVCGQPHISIDATDYTCYSGLSETSYTIEEISITNDSKGTNYYIWIDNVPTKNMEDSKKIWSYFKRRKNDFSLQQIMSEINIVKDTDVNIGFDFLKLLRPHETFYIIVKTTDKKSAVLDYISVIDCNTVEKRVGTIPEHFLFKSSVLVVETTK